MSSPVHPSAVTDSPQTKTQRSLDRSDSLPVLVAVATVAPLRALYSAVSPFERAAAPETVDGNSPL